MTKLEALRNISTKPGLANLLGVKATTLTYTLYVLDKRNQYVNFEIEKRSGGTRTILAPTDRLKTLQRCLSRLLLDCVDEINQQKQADRRFKPTMSHGFSRNRSIITNAGMHTNNKNVLNIDLDNFFGSFNFGRVRGFFISNRNFEINPHIATVIAQIACYDNQLPQGSPCSPVISNLITHSLDIRLAALAHQNSCTYTRYADDITFSTREKKFPKQIARRTGREHFPGKKLQDEIKRAGFSINKKKTRVQFNTSRQDVTGLVVNKKINVKKEYWRTTKAQCHSLFTTGKFTKTTNEGVVDGSLNELEGKLNFIDQIDHHNRQKHSIPKNSPLNGREKTLRRFLFYKYFYGNALPTILTEGKTDNVYLKAAIKSQAKSYPQLATPRDGGKTYQPLLNFFEYSERSSFILELKDGAGGQQHFMGNFQKQHDFYQAPAPKHPVIIVYDNDDGAQKIKSFAKNGDIYWAEGANEGDFTHSEFIHITRNLYLILTPLKDDESCTEIEDLFDNPTLETRIKGKTFNRNKSHGDHTTYGKDYFASMVRDNRNEIDFSGFNRLLERIIKVIQHYESIK